MVDDGLVRRNVPIFQDSHRLKIY